MPASTEPYVLRPTGFKNLGFKAVLRTTNVQPILIIDAAGIHWPDPRGGSEFVIAWHEMTELVRQRYMGMRALFIMVSDLKAVLARHPMKNLPKLGAPSHFCIFQNVAPLDEVIQHIRRFSDVPIREA